MSRLIERNSSFRFRLADHNRDHHQDSLLRTGKAVVTEDDVKGHIKSISIREVPTLSRLLRVANGVNSCSARVFGTVFEIAKTS